MKIRLPAAILASLSSEQHTQTGLPGNSNKQKNKNNIYYFDFQSAPLRYLTELVNYHCRAKRPMAVLGGHRLISFVQSKVSLGKREMAWIGNEPNLELQLQMNKAKGCLSCRWCCRTFFLMKNFLLKLTKNTKELSHTIDR